MNAHQRRKQRRYKDRRYKESFTEWKTSIFDSGVVYEVERAKKTLVKAARTGLSGFKAN